MMSALNVQQKARISYKGQYMKLIKGDKCMQKIQSHSISVIMKTKAQSEHISACA